MDLQSVRAKRQIQLAELDEWRKKTHYCPISGKGLV